MSNPASGFCFGDTERASRLRRQGRQIQLLPLQLRPLSLLLSLQQSKAHFKHVVPQATFVTIPNSTHYLYSEQSAATAQAMRTFLAAHDGV